jgi:hypothetical protein
MVSGSAKAYNQVTELNQPSPMIYQCLLLLQQVRDLTSSNKALRASWTNKDEVMKAVLKLFVLCRGDTGAAEESSDLVRSTSPSASTSANAPQDAPMEIIQSLILDLLADVDESMMAKAPLPKVSHQRESILMVACGSTQACNTATNPVCRISYNEQSHQAGYIGSGHGGRSIH